jgi:hypothetical protein
MARTGRNIEACIARVAARGAITQSEAAQLLEDVAVRAEQMRATGEFDTIVAAAGAAAMGIKEKARADLVDAIRNADRRVGMIARAKAESGGQLAPDRNLAQRIGHTLVGGSKDLGIADGIASQMHWVAGAKQKDNAQSRWHTMYRATSAAMVNRLRQEGLLGAAREMKGTSLEREVAEAFWRRNGGAPDARITISTAGQTIADALYPAVDTIKRRQNAEGARIGTATDYVSHTNWDPRQLQLAAGPGATHDAAFRAWRAKEEPRAAAETFNNLVPEEGESMADARTRFLRSWFDATSSGVHLRQSGMAGMAADEGGFIPPAFMGTHNIARSVSHPRIWHWNNSGDWLDHMREFGGGDGLLAQVNRTIDAGARRTALMRYFGTNPEANLNLVIKKVREEFRTDHEGLQRFDAQAEGLRNVMGRLDGSLNMPVNADHAAAFEAVMSIEAASHLGAISLTHMSAAPATFGSEMAHHGVGRWETIRNLTGALVHGRGGAVEQEAMADAGAYAHGWSNMLARDAGMHGAGVPGFVSYWAAQFMRVTGLPTVLDRFQAGGVKGVLMDRLGRAANAPLEQMEIHQRTVLTSYGIGPDEWDLVRGAANPAVVGDRRWVTPHDAIASDPDEVAALLRRQGLLPNVTPDDPALSDAQREALIARILSAVQKKQWEMADRLGMYLNDAADRGAVTSGVREQAMALRGLRPGDPYYMVARALLQFKMWPLAAANQIMGREIALSLSGKEMASNIGALIALATAGGMLRMAVNDAVTGNAQRDYRNPVTLLAALAQGGGLGIYGDFLFGETSRLGGGGIATMVGPIGSDIDRLYRMYTDFKIELRDHPEKALSHLWPDLARFASGHVPFANLIYLKGALDYLVWYHLYDAASPGWWERTNRRLARETGRTMLGYEPGGGVPWGVPGIYTATRSESGGLFGHH